MLNWNGLTDTLACLDSLGRLTTAHDVLVVDNGSTDGSEGQIRRYRPGIRLLQTGANLGYAGGNNRGIQESLADDAEFVWVLNNDARPRPDALRALLIAMNDDVCVGILASAVEPRSVATALLRGEHVLCEGCKAGFHEADMVMGCSLFFRSDVFREVGLFDERYFHYAEEQDIAMRTHLAGWRLGLACTSIVGHESTTKVAQRADVAIGSVYQFFPDKRAIAQELALRNLELFGERVARGLAEGDFAHWYDAVGTVIDIFVDMHRTVPGFRVLRFGDIADVRLLDAGEENNAVVADRLRALLVEAFAVPDTEDLARALRSRWRPPTPCSNWPSVTHATVIRPCSPRRSG